MSRAVSGRIDAVQGVLVLEDGRRSSDAQLQRYQALERWSTQIAALHNTILSKFA